MNLGGNGDTESRTRFGVACGANEEHEVGAVDSATGVLDSKKLDALEKTRFFGERVRGHTNKARIERLPHGGVRK